MLVNSHLWFLKNKIDRVQITKEDVRAIEKAKFLSRLGEFIEGKIPMEMNPSPRNPEEEELWSLRMYVLKEEEWAEVRNLLYGIASKYPETFDRIQRVFHIMHSDK